MNAPERRPLRGRIIAATIVGFTIALFTTFALAQTAPTTRPSLDDRLAAIDARASQVADLAATFEQQKFSPLLREPLVTRGTIRAKGATMVWRSEQPEPMRTRVTLERLQIYYAKQNVVEDYPIAGKLGELAASPLPKLATLRERFKITEDAGDGFPAPAGVTDALVLRLEPIEPEVRQYVDHLRVLLDPSRGLVLRFELVDPDGERTLIRFEEIKTNTGFADAELQLGAPSNVKIVKPLEPGK